MDYSHIQKPRHEVDMQAHFGTTDMKDRYKEMSK